MSKLVLVTGASGFIAQHVVLQLLDRGYQVRGTTRSPDKASETRAVLERAKPGAGGVVNFASASLEAEAGWREAMEGADAVVHVASPIPLAQPKDRDALVGPARDGALRLLKAASQTPSVKKVVMTSSVAAVADGHGPRKNHVFSEADWSNPEGPNISPYARSKTIAERAAWDFIAREKPGFAFSTVLPGLVLGPVLSADYGVSPEIVRRLMAGEVPGAPRLGWESVDVRDVADLHVKALEAPAADGERFIASSEFIWMADMARALREDLGDQARKVPAGTVPDFVLKLMGLLDPAVRGVLPDLGRKVEASHEKATRLLNWRPCGAREAVIAAAKSMVAHGIV